MTDGNDRATDAFRRLLADAAAGGQAKVDAIVALIQRTVFVATWTPDGSGFRTLMNSQGQSALPVFTSREELLNAGRRFAWVEADGSVPHREVGAREALRHGIAHELAYVVVDIASPHALEIDRTEVAPMLTPEGRREAAGPYAAVGRISSNMMAAVRPSTTPPTGNDVSDATFRHPSGGLKAAGPAPSGPPTTTASSIPPSSAAPSSAGPSSVPHHGATSPHAARSQVAAATFGTGSTVSLTALGSEPTEALLDALAAVLREYPEVEWAAMAAVARGPASSVPTVCMRIDTGYRARVGEIISRVRVTGDELGATLDCLLLDDAVVMRTARQVGLAFFPWRKK
jgi:hypothetical protein